MSNALESASLIMYPSGYSNGVLGSVKPTDGTGDFTFTRGAGDTCTRVGPNGYIEKGYENLLLQSDWDDVGTQTPPTGWSSFSPSHNYEAGSETGRIRFNTSSSRGYIQQSQPYTSGVFTFSVYCDSVTISESLNSIFYPIGSTIINYQQNGVVVPANTQLSAGNRYSVTFSLTGYSFTTRIGSGCFTNVTADFTLSRPMLNQGLVAYPYIETTTAPVAGGILEDEPRIDFSDGCGHLLLEPSRTNLVPHSEYFGGWQISNNPTITANATTSPEGVDNAYLLTSTEVSSRVQVPVSPTGTNIQSVYIKYAGSDARVRISGLASSNSRFEVNVTSSGVAFHSAESGIIDYSIEAAGNDWYRVTSTQSGGNYYQIYIDVTGNDGSIYIWGAQLEQDATYPTSYIPTYGVSQTRLKDTTATLSSTAIAGATEFTWFFDNTDSVIEPAALPIFWLRSELNENLIYWATNGGRFNSITYFGFSDAVGKVCVKYDGTTFTMFLNGVKSNDTLTKSFAATSELRALNYTDGGFSGPLHKMLFFKTALSDDECIALTTI